MSKVAPMSSVRSKQLPIAERHARSAAFLRAAAVQRHVGIEHGDSETAAEAVLNGQEFLVDERRATTVRALRDAAMGAGWTAANVAFHQQRSKREINAARTVVSAYIMGTSLALSTLLKVMPIDGWYAQLAMEMLPRAR